MVGTAISVETTSADINATSARNDPHCNDEVTDLRELLETYPREAAMVMKRGIEISMFLSCVLFGHCAVLVSYSNPSRVDSEIPILDRFLTALCIGRLIMMVPRPLVWIHRWSRSVEVQRLQTPRLISDRLLEIHTAPCLVVDRVLRVFFYTWLITLGLVTTVVRISPFSTELNTEVWHHVFLTFFCLAVHRILCVVLFVRFTRSDMNRGIDGWVIEKETCLVRLGKETDCLDQLGEFASKECSICLCSYASGQEIRRLGCGHCFHGCCVDEWLTKRSSKCPLCLQPVGKF